jgi:hypothetical protein
MFNNKKAVLKISLIAFLVFSLIIAVAFIVPVLGDVGDEDETTNETQEETEEEIIPEEIVNEEFSVTGDIGILNTHFSTVEITSCTTIGNLGECIIAGGVIDHDFELKVCNDVSSPHDIREFRIYYEYEDFTDFTDVQCQPKTGWDKVVLTTIWGKACIYSSEAEGNNIEPEECTDFKFTADTPEEGCCRTLRFETTDEETPIGDVNRIDAQVCVDATPPITIKSFIGPQKIIQGPVGLIEWIDGVTLVNLSVEDVGPHKSGIKGTWYKNILVENFTKELGVENCESPCENQTICNNLKWFANDSRSGEWVEYSEPFPKAEESCHILYYYSEDNTGNIEGVNVNCFYVDKTPPKIWKEVGEPSVSCEGKDLILILENKNSTWGIIEDGVKATLKYDSIGLTFKGTLTTTGLSEETNYSLIYYPDKEDRSDPLKWNGEGGKVIATFEGDVTDLAIDNNLGINLPNAGDWNIAPSPDYCDYHNTFDDYEHCSGAKIWIVKTDDLTSGNLPLINWNPTAWLFETDLITYTQDERDCDYWVSTKTPITLNCEDQLPHPSGDVTIYYRWKLDDGSWNEGSYEGGSYTLSFNEDSVHDLEFWCSDAVNKTSEKDYETFRVDGTKPNITKTMIGTEHLGYRGGVLNQDACPPKEQGDVCYVKDSGENGVRIDVADPDPTQQGCAINNVQCEYELWWMNETINSGTFGEEGKDIIFDRDSTHTLKIWCEDELGNEVEDIEEFLVDSTPPVTNKTYIPDAYTDGQGNKYIDTIHKINLTAEDAKVGVDKIYYRYCLVEKVLNGITPAGASLNGNGNPCTCEGIGFIEYTTPFGIPDESQHCIEYYSVDLLGNTESPKSQLVYVDKTKPVINKIYDGQQYPQKIDSNTPYPHYINSQTNVVITATDPEPHPSGINKIEYRVTLLDGNDACLNNNVCQEKTGTSDFLTYLNPFIIAQDSCHLIEIKATDNVGKFSEHKQCVFVDSKAPEIVKTIEGPKYYNESERKLYIDGVTNISVTAIDPQPHPVDAVTCDWGYSVVGTNIIGGKNNVTSPFIINFPEESEHFLTITCWDALGNEVVDTETFYVDKTAPNTTKEYGEPKVIKDNGKWINNQTLITLSVDDTGPHKSGIKETKYRVSLVEDSNCSQECLADGTSDFLTYLNPFTIAQDSCHLIEYYSVDNVDKTEVTKKQCVFVDNQAPEPNKTVGEPKTKWYPVDVATDPFNPDATHFYPWIVNKCWNGGGDEIECWKVTLDTKISMECTDPEPHPVDNEKVCFRVELDAEDETNSYCETSLNDDGYCCVNNEIEEFKFKEESEHNLEYYCVDALGNKGPVDEEKFKVTGKLFKIKINDKWNLISVPFVLLNDSPKQVFKNTESVQTVWSYNGETGKWSVYRPGEDYGTNNLEHIEPGLGYWVLADCEAMTNNEFTIEDFKFGCDKDKCEMLVVGGSLYNPGPVVPPSQKLAEGWNLIGYYGTEGRWWYIGPNAFYFKDSKEAYCALYSLRNLNGGTKWSALIGYWEPDNPYQWTEYGLHDEMDPGAGYWVSMDAEGNYKPETICESI